MGAEQYAAFSGRLLIVGFGSIGQGFLPLVLRHIDVPRNRITILTADPAGQAEAEEYGIDFVIRPLSPDNFSDILGEYLDDGDFLINLTVDVSSVDLITFCHERNILYIDTVVEPWAGYYTDPDLSPSQRSNYALRETAIGLKDKFAGGPTAVITHGANPGLVSHFVKQALLNIAADTGLKVDQPQARDEWAALARKLNVKTVHIAERDTQVTDQFKKPGEFVNTWSVEGFISEGRQPAELGWGTHEKYFPEDGARHDFGSGAAIYLNRPGAGTRVRTWTPKAGTFQGYLVTHNESISIADYFTVSDQNDIAYRPTVHYAYHPCNAAVLSLHEMEGKNWQEPKSQLLVVDEIVKGIDELGVLLMGHERGAYWYGSQLSIDEARALAPWNNATSLQVCVAVLAGVIWAMENPRAGLCEPEEIDFKRILEIATPYLGPVVGAYTDWTPVKGRSILFDEDVDTEDPWQFKNFRVI